MFKSILYCIVITYNIINFNFYYYYYCVNKDTSTGTLLT